MQPIGSPTLELVLAGADPQGRVLQSAPPVNHYAGYLPMPPGAYVLKICRAGNHDTPIKSFNINLKNDAYLTFLVAPTFDGSPVTAEMIDDTPDPTKPPVNKLTIRQFCPNVRVQITTAARINSDLLEAGGVQTLNGFPNGQVALAMRATLANGTVRTWNAEADFRSARHASLLVFADPYGRIRPRVSVDGPSPADEDAVAQEVAVAGLAHTP